MRPVIVGVAIRMVGYLRVWALAWTNFWFCSYIGGVDFFLWRYPLKWSLILYNTTILLTEKLAECP